MDKKEIGERIAEMRQLRGITQNELAEMTGLRQTHLSRIEQGMYMPRIDIAERIAKALNCDINDFIK